MHPITSVCINGFGLFHLFKYRAVNIIDHYVLSTICMHRVIPCEKYQRVIAPKWPLGVYFPPNNKW